MTLHFNRQRNMKKENWNNLSWVTKEKFGYLSDELHIVFSIQAHIDFQPLFFSKEKNFSI